MNNLLKRMPYLAKNPRAEIEISPGGIPFNGNIPVMNRKMQIVIPTHQRTARQITLKSLSPELQREVMVVTSLEEDAVAIRELHADILRKPSKQVISIEKFAGRKMMRSIDGIAKKRQWIIENIGATSIFQMDDDQYIFARCALKKRHYVNGSWTIKEKFKSAEQKLLGKSNLTPDQLTQTFRDLADRMTRKEERYPHVGMSSRMGNNQEEHAWKVNGRLMHSIGHRRDVLIKNNVRFDEVLIREDFNVTLRLLKLGMPNTIYYDVCGSPAEYGFKGGCFEERTPDLSNKQALLLAKLHPGLVKVVEKMYKDNPRKEVVVSWKKSFGMETAKKKSLFG